MEKIKVIIVDDEPLAREVLKGYLAAYPEVSILAECSNGFDCLKSIKSEQPDLLFLDIQMPKIDGFEMLEIIEEKPEIIFVTAFDQYAIKAFEANAVDYLMKPYSRERFDQAFQKAKERIAKALPQGKDAIVQLSKADTIPGKILERVIIKKGVQIIVVPVQQIYYVEAEGDYVTIHAESGSYLKEKTMKYYEDNLPSGAFARIHRSYIVNIASIEKLELYEKETYMVLLKNGAKLRASREGYRRLKELM